MRKSFSLTHEANPHRIKATIDVKEFVGLIKQPRAIMLLVPAGKPVDTAIESLLPYLDKDSYRWWKYILYRY
jgi:6-phosphogluconate dehydrogenase